MASRYLEILLDIKSKLDAVADVGKTHDFLRYANEATKFLSLFKTAIGGKDQIRGWMITRSGPVAEHKRGAYFRHHRFRLYGIMGLQDTAQDGTVTATDKTWQQLVDNVCEKFRTAEPPAGASWYYRDGDNPDNAPAQVAVNEIRYFSNQLCHWCEIEVHVTERIVA